MTSDPAAFVHCYFGDVLCLPVCIPVTLWLQRKLSLRRHDLRPTGVEIGLYWILWTGCFEWLGPLVPALAPGAVADPWDAVAYAIGGLIAAMVWREGRCPRQGGAPSAYQLIGRAAIAMVVAVCVLSAYRFGVVFQ